MNVADEKNQNLTELQTIYLITYKTFSHTNGGWYQELLRERAFYYGDGNIEKLQPVLPTIHKITRSCNIARCQYTRCRLAKLNKQTTEV